MTFETKTCSRCGGSGHYSFNQVNGTTCFGCGGSGKRMTKRGAAARAYFRASIEKPATEIKPGDYIFASVTMLGQDRWCKVDAVHPAQAQEGDGHARGWIDYSRKGNGCSYGFGAETILRSVRTEEERAAKLAAAYAYQETLTQAGKPSKKKIRETA